MAQALQKEEQQRDEAPWSETGSKPLKMGGHSTIE